MLTYLGGTSGHHSLYPLSPTETHGPPVEVALTRLDDVIGANSTMTLVKIDAEGAELDILEGARLLIERTHEIALIVEFGPSHLKRTGCSTKDWFLSFERFGLRYEVIDADTGALEFWPIDRLETVESVNLLFARPEAAVWRKAEALRRKA